MLQIVWFKRDLRVFDNEALCLAAERGPVLPLYIIEPELWQQSDMAGRHWGFVRECLQDLQQQLAGLGQALVIRRGEALDVLGELLRQYPAKGLWSHQDPELASVPDQWIHMPWQMPGSEQVRCGTRIGRDYPMPLVDHLGAAREARQRIQAARRSHDTREQSRSIYTRHGSRCRPPIKAGKTARRAGLLSDGP